jgi:hypothetical protein
VYVRRQNAPTSLDDAKREVGAGYFDDEQFLEH